MPGNGVAVSIARTHIGFTSPRMLPSPLFFMSANARLTPMLQQYFEAKARAGGALLLYRMGDFFELFFEDATTAAPLLGLTLTSRNKDSDIEAPMCGMPHHAVEGHIAQLVAAGHRVA